MNGKRKFAFSVVCMLVFAFASAYGEILNPALFRRSAELSISYTRSSTLTNFPLLVRLSTVRLPGFTPARAGENGTSVRFADADGKLLNHEIDEFNADGDSLYWVSVPYLKSGTKLTVFWDPFPSAELPEVSPSAVWDSADYVGVWHFNDTNLTNSASSEIPIYYSAGCIVSNDIGQTGLCIRRTKSLTVEDYLKHGVDRTHYTWSMWIRWANHPVNEQKNYIMKGAYVSSNGGWFTEYKRTPNSLALFSGTTGVGFGTAVAVDWNHLAMSYDGANIRTFINGTASNPKPNNIQDGNYNFSIGSCGDTWQDELRIRNAVSIPDWMYAEKTQYSDPNYVLFSVNAPRAERVQLDTTQFQRFAAINANGYTEMATLTNFPLLVRLSSARLPGFDPAAAGEGGANLRFADLNGTLLSHDVDEWNEEGDSIIWVSVPEFKPGTKIAIYWDPKPGAQLPEVNASDVWDAAGYCGVWHCGTTELTDVSSASIPASYAEGAAISNDVAFAGRGIRRDGIVTIADYIYRGVGGKHWSFSGYFQWPAHTENGQFSYIRKGNFDNRQGWFTEYKNTLTGLNIAYGTGSTAYVFSLGSVLPTEWHHFVLTYDGVNLVGYINGYEAGRKEISVSNGQYDLKLNNSVNAGMDEVRVRNFVSSAAWVNAEKEMLSDPDFVTFTSEIPKEPVESLGSKFADLFNGKIRITMPGYVADATEANFPMLVRLTRGNPRPFDPASCGEGGSELRFFDEAGNLLPHDIDEWNPNGESLVWVLVPELKAGASVVMCYAPRVGGAIPALDPALVWSRAGYKAVWHFASAGASMPSSAFGSMPMTPENVEAVSNVTGVVGQALSKGTVVTSPDYYAHNIRGNGPYSVSFWLRIPNLTTAYHYQPVKKGEWQNGWMLEVRNSLTQPRVCHNSKWKAVPFADMLEWNYFTFSYENNQASFYYNGTHLGLDWGGVNANPAPFMLNSNGVCTEQLDEVRVRATTASAARQNLEILNMTDPDFVAFEILRDPGMVIYLR